MTNDKQTGTRQIIRNSDVADFKLSDAEKKTMQWELTKKKKKKKDYKKQTENPPKSKFDHCPVH